MSMDHLLACQCGEVLVKSIDGTTKVRGKVFLFRDGKGYVVCKGCGAERQVPMFMDLASLTTPVKAPRLFVERSKKGS